MLEHLTTEARNPASEDLDGLTAAEIVELINSEDAKVAAEILNRLELKAEKADRFDAVVTKLAEVRGQCSKRITGGYCDLKVDHAGDCSTADQRKRPSQP